MQHYFNLASKNEWAPECRESGTTLNIPSCSIINGHLRCSVCGGPLGWREVHGTNGITLTPRCMSGETSACPY